MKVKLGHLTIEYRRRPVSWRTVAKKRFRGRPWCQVLVGPIHGYSERGYVIITEQPIGRSTEEKREKR